MVFGIFGGGGDDDISRMIKLDKKGNYVPIVERDSKGRIIHAKGTIPYRPQGATSGSLITAAIRKQLVFEKLPGDDIGHIIPKGLGGSGDDRDNVFPQNARINRSIAFQEKMLRQRQQQFQLNIKFDISFSYDDSSRPEECRYIYTEEDKDGNVTGKMYITLKNPSGDVTKEMTMEAVKAAYMIINQLLESIKPSLEFQISKSIMAIFAGICKGVELSIRHPGFTMATTTIAIPSGRPSLPEFIKPSSSFPLPDFLISK